MKICPTCRKTYADAGLNFCLDDGTQLNVASGDLPETVMMNNPGQTFSQGTPTATANVPQTMQASWGPTPNYSLQPQKKSSAWKWVLGLGGIIVLLCGGSFIVVAFLGFLIDPGNSGIVTENSNTVITTESNTSTTTLKSGKNIPLEGWVKAAASIGDVEYTNGELLMASKSKQFYLVLLASKIYSTDGVSTSVTVRNVDNVGTRMGYGLVFHSDPKPLQQAYAFLIDTKLRRYRVVRHQPKQEIEVIKWTNSTTVNGGTEKNVLEVRDNEDNIDFYINGKKVNTIRNTHGFTNGVPGLYSGEGVKAAFSGLNTK